MSIVPFEPLPAVVGGVMIGTASAAALALNGKIPGVSGVFGRMLQGVRGDTAWRVAFVLGLIAGGALVFRLYPPSAAFVSSRSLGAFAAAGLLVGLGTRIGGGCTSGHGVCGVARGSFRSIVATLTFVLAGFATVYVVRHVLGRAVNGLMRAALMFLPGVLFGVGLGVSGMTNPAKVIGFLDLAGAWDPTLALVMAGAAGSFAVLRLLIHRRAAPILGGAMPSTPSGGIDARLLLGAVLFGVGWGVAGFCPGPAIANVGGPRLETLAFIPAMAVGMIAAQRLFGADA